MISFQDHMHQSAREYLAHVLTACDGNVSRAARVAKINRTYFYKLLARYGVQLNRASVADGRSSGYEGPSNSRRVQR